MLRALAIASALGFLTLVMVQAMAFYAPPPPNPPKTPNPRDYMLSAPTKAGPVVRSRRRAEPAEPADRRYLLPATKAGILGPLKISPPEPAPQQQGTPPPRR